MTDKPVIGLVAPATGRSQECETIKVNWVQEVPSPAPSARPRDQRARDTIARKVRLDRIGEKGPTKATRLTDASLVEACDLVQRARAELRDIVAWFDIGPMRKYTGTVVGHSPYTNSLLVRKPDSPGPTTVFLSDLVAQRGRR